MTDLIPADARTAPQSAQRDPGAYRETENAPQGLLGACGDVFGAMEVHMEAADANGAFANPTKEGK